MRLPLLLALPGMVVIAGTLALATGPLASPGAEGQASGMQQGEFELAIDADVENGNGPCDPIDDEADVEAGATHQVAVCVLNPPVPIFAFLTRVVYDGQLNRAPELPDVLPALDDNPDANAGDTTFSSPSLGARWNCSGLGLYPPRGDDEFTPEKNDAVLACVADLRDPDTTLAQSGPLQVITFEAIGQGDDRIEFDPSTEIGSANETIGNCGDIVPTIPCHGAVLHNAGGGPSSTEPTAPAVTSPQASAAAPTPQRTPVTSVEAASPTAVETNAEADEDGGFPWAVLGGALGGAALLVAAMVGLYAWRRSSRLNV